MHFDIDCSEACMCGLERNFERLQLSRRSVRGVCRRVEGDNYRSGVGHIGVWVDKLGSEEAHLRELGHMHILVVGRAEEHEATIIFETLVGYFARGDGLATEGFDRIDVELSKWERESALQEARWPDKKY
jgi:hypothetical protein